MNRYNPLQDCHLDFNTAKTFVSDSFSLREKAEAASIRQGRTYKVFLYVQLPFCCRDKLKCRLYLPLLEFFNEVETEVTGAVSYKANDTVPTTHADNRHILVMQYTPAIPITDNTTDHTAHTNSNNRLDLRTEDHIRN